MKGLFVDFDGTLVNSVPALWECYRAFLNKYGIIARPQDFKKLMGPSLLEIIVLLKKHYALKEDALLLLEQYNSLVADAYKQEVDFFPYALKCLKKAKAQNFKIAIVSSAPGELVESLLIAKGALTAFDAIFCPLPKEPSKPDPAIYKRAVAALKVDALKSFAIEDSISGVKSAQAASIKTFHFTQNKTWQDVESFLQSF